MQVNYLCGNAAATADFAGLCRDEIQRRPALRSIACILLAVSGGFAVC